MARGFFYELDYQAALGASSSARIDMLTEAMNHLLRGTLKDGTQGLKDFGRRFYDAAATLAKAFKLAAWSTEAADYAEEVAFRFVLQKCA